MKRRIVLDLTDMQARGLAMIAGSLTLDDYGRAVQYWVDSHSQLVFPDANADEKVAQLHRLYLSSPTVASDEDAKAAMFEAMSAATSALYAALADIGFDVLNVDDDDQE